MRLIFRHDAGGTSTILAIEYSTRQITIPSVSTSNDSTQNQPSTLPNNKPPVIGPVVMAGNVLGILPFQVTLRAGDGNAFPSQDIVLDSFPSPFLAVACLSGHTYIASFPNGHENGVLGVGVFTDVLYLTEDAPPVLRVGGSVAYVKTIVPGIRQIMDIWGHVTFYQR